MPTIVHDRDIVRVVQSSCVVTARQGWMSGGSGEPYTGTYEVTPTTSEQTLPTERRFLSDDVTVHSIPYVETTNEQGGYTISIAS